MGFELSNPIFALSYFYRKNNPIKIIRIYNLDLILCFLILIFQFLQAMKTKLLTLALIISLTSCRDKQLNQSVELDFNNDYEQLSPYFATATYGVISTGTIFKYTLQYPLTEEPSDEQLQKFISFEPSVKGQTKITNNTFIEFVPEHTLLPNQKYKIKFDFDVLQSSNYQGKINYSVMTFPQEVKIENNGFKLDADRSMTHFLKITLADPVKSDDLIRCFESNATSINTDKNSTADFSVAFKFDNGISTFNYIHYDLSPIHINDKGKIKLYEISNKFEVVTTIHRKESKEVSFYFSKPLDAKMDYSGLISVSSGSFTYSINRNILSIYYTLSGYEFQKKITLSNSIKSSSGKPLTSDYVYQIDTKSIKPEVKFVKEGNYLPGQYDFKVPIMTRNLNSIQLAVVEVKQQAVPHPLIWAEIKYLDKYTLRKFGKLIYNENVKLDKGVEESEGWVMHAIDLTDRINKNPGSIYYISIDFGPMDTNMPCRQQLSQLNYNYKTPSKKDFNWKSGESYRYYYNFYDYYGEDYDWKQRDNPCRKEFYIYKDLIDNTYLCTDYGIIAKKAGNNYNIHVFDLVTLKPIINAKTQAFDLQGEVLATTQTDLQGFASFKSYDVGVYAVKITKGKHIVWLPLNEYIFNDLTDFDISGTRSETESQTFVYTDRDIYRPGDSIHVDLMINHRTIDIPDGVPIVMSFYNVDNLKIDEQVKSFQKKQHLIYNFSTKTGPQSKTGDHLMVFTLGPLKVSKRIRIETIRPNTTNAIIAFEGLNDRAVYRNYIRGEMKLESLTGLPVEGAQVSIFARYLPLEKPFPKFSNFRFNRLQKRSNDSEFLTDSKTDNKGLVTLSNNLNIKDFNSPISMNLEIESVLPGGGLNKQGKSFEVFPFDSYVGVSVAKGKGMAGSFLVSETPEFDIVNIDERQGSIANNAVAYRILKSEKFWWLDKYSITASGKYLQEDYWSVVEEGKINVAKGKAKVKIKNPYGDGVYKIEITDMSSGHVAENFFNVAKDGSWIPGSEPYMLNFELDKEEYDIDDVMTVSLPPVNGAKALISIEQGDKIIHHQWEECSSKTKKISINITEEWVPNVYVHVTMVQAYKDNGNDLPLRTYGIRQAKINYLEKQLTPVIKTNENYQSNKEYTIKISEELGRHMEYTLAVVDEGLLNLTGYKTPDPQEHFTGKFPLLTKTWDIYIYLVKYFKAKYAGIISIGGDGTYNPDVLPEIERFKPINMHYGPFKLAAGKTNLHKIKIPNYIGRLRIMVVACNEKRFGSAQKLVSVKNPIMIQSQMPRALNISDQLDLPITVIKSNKNIKSAKLVAQTDGKSISGLTSTVNLDLSGKDQLIYSYSIKVGESAGPTRFTFRVESADNSMNETTDIVINYPNSYENKSTYYNLAPGEVKELSISPSGFPEVFQSELLITGVQTPNILEFGRELLSYPYGCLEQITSTGFSQLYFDELLDLSPEEHRIRKENIEAVLEKYSRYRTSNGNFNAWPSYNFYNVWSDLWAGHFLIALKNKGLLSNRDALLDGWIEYHYSNASGFSARNLSSTDVYENEVLYQAYRLYLLAKAGSPNKAAMNVLSLSLTAQHPMTYWFLAGAYKYSGFESKAMEFVDKAESLMITNFEQFNHYHYGSNARNKALMVGILTLFPELREKTENYYQSMVETFNRSSWNSTQEMGACFEAVAAYLQYTNSTLNDISYTINKANKTENFTHRSNKLRHFKLTSTDLKNKIVVKNIGQSPIHIAANERFISKDVNIPATNQNLELSVSYNGMEYADEKYFVEAGQNVDIVIRIKNPQALEINDLALNLKMPSGLELMNPRIYGNESNPNNSEYQYQDFKDDRVYTFFDLGPGRTSTFVFKAKAAFTGEFYLPPVTCEAMYNNKIYARSKSGSVKVKTK